VSSQVALVLGFSALGLAIVLFVIAVGLPGRRHSGTAQALTAIRRRYGWRPAPAADEAVTRLEPPMTWLRGLALQLSPSGAGASLQRRLDIAGNPQRWNADRILAAKGLGLLALGGLGGLYMLRSPALGILGALLGAAAGFYLPDLLLYNTGLKRQDLLQRALPDALDLLTICVEAGLGFDAAMSRVSLNTEGPLAAEFARVLQEMQIGESRSAALRSLAGRTTVTELGAFVTALIQAGELGVAVADVLREQAREMRLRRRQRAEEQAQKVPVKILLPLIGCLFPALFVIVMGPGVLTIIHSVFRR
jgi:tight adherence protein C